ncbi:hypothetical protein GCM10023187_09620 [Nibrella viscosa]|uniref:Por secretion system C-terminal sorting domain-containing protein n=1 Tax=Nibrella viscosa TaxID=1084524 RepID=A0ABP8K032_9BACT
MNIRILSLGGLLLVAAHTFAATPPTTRQGAARLAAGQPTYTTIASSLNPSTVGAPITFTSTTRYPANHLDENVTEGTVTFSEGATVLAADVPVVTGVASFTTSTLTVGTHTIVATYNGTANFSTSKGSVVQTIDNPGSCSTYAGNIAYVNGAAAVGTNDGTTWARAFLTLQDALDAARTCSVTQIWVAQGTYVPTNYPIGAATTRSGGVLTSADFSFHLVNGVAIYGGFSGTGTETLLSQRNWVLNPTILSGTNARNHVVTSANDGLTTRLDGFTITGGRADGNTLITVEGLYFYGNRGAGAALNGSSVTLSNLLISGNSCFSTDNGGGSGGGMAMYGGNSIFTNVAFVGNSAYSGGGLETSSTSFVMTNCVFSGNTVNSGGGGMIVSSGSSTLTNVVFANNAATRTSPSAFGGAMINNGCVMTLINCTFFGNTAPGTGGTMYSVNGATVTDKNGIYYNNTNNGNTAYNGVFNYRASGSPFPGPYDSFTGTTTLTGTDPLFVNAADPDGPDNRWMTADDGMAIQSTSPAINAGTPSGAPATDIRGFTRTGNPDQGAYEYQACSNITYYVDADRDGYGSTTTAVLCDATAPVGYATNNTDCNDNDGSVHEAQLYYVDADRDGYGSTQTAMVCSSTAPVGYATNNTDCNDNDGSVHEAQLYYVDADGDGYGSTQTAMVCSSTAPAGYATNNTDQCPNDPKKIAPGACGCGVVDTDTDSDGIADCNDPCPLAVNGIANFDPAACGCATGFTPVMNGNVITGCQCTLSVSLGLACRQVYAGYDAASNTTVLTATATGQGGSGYTYLWSNGATSASITVSPATTTIYSVTVSKSGCSAIAAVTVNVINVACDKNKVMICHNGQTLCVAKTGKNGVADHLAHGDKLGSCNTVLPCNTTGTRLATIETNSEPLTDGWLAYPNPFEQTLTLQLQTTIAGTADIVLVDLAGRSVVSKQQLLVEGANKVVLETGQLASGLYIVRLTDAAKVVRTLKVLKK